MGFSKDEMSSKRRWGWSEGCRPRRVVFLEDVYSAEGAGFVLDYPLHQTTFVEHMFTNLNLHVFLALPHTLQADGALDILHGYVP